MRYFAICFLCVAVPSAAPAVTPERFEYNGVLYHAVRAEPAQVRILLVDGNGARLRTFPSARKHLLSLGETPSVLMNGGIFEPEGVPSGLLIQRGVTHRMINRRDGDGNFFLKPNGVLVLTGDKAAVIDSREFGPPHVAADYAVQSGPLLLRRGQTHASFRPDSNSRLHRNGVGVTDDGSVLFLMTDIDSPKFPNLFEFADVFRHHKCVDALFLDGDLCQMATGPAMAEPLPLLSECTLHSQPFIQSEFVE